jgi:hypothetical protein
MNLKFALMQALLAFVVIYTVSHFLLGRPNEIALIHGGAAAAIMGLLMGYLSRDTTEHVSNVTPKQAADAAVAVLGGVQSHEPNGAIRVQTGFNYFWLAVTISPSKGGVDLRGSANHIRYVKNRLTGG